MSQSSLKPDARAQHDRGRHAIVSQAEHAFDGGIERRRREITPECLPEEVGGLLSSGCRILVTLLHEMQRRNAKKFAEKGALFENLEPEKWGYTQLFEYMIGNTDWSLSGLHNITLARDTTGMVNAIPFDFDWAGAVNARYAFPDKSLPIRQVTERLWRGDCRTAAELTPSINHFKERRAALDSAWNTIEGMTPVVQERMRKYFADFWSLIDNPKLAAAEFKKSCVVGN